MKEKVKEFFQKPIGKISAFVGTLTAGVSSAFASFAADATVTDGAEAAKTLMGEVTKTLNVSNMVTIITAGIGAVLALFLAWWGARKLMHMVVNVFNHGEIKF